MRAMKRIRVAWVAMLALAVCVPTLAAADFEVVRDSAATAVYFNGKAVHETGNAIQNEREVAVTATTRVMLWEEVSPSGHAVPYYAIARGDAVLRVTATSYVLKLRHGEFDPAFGAPAVVGPAPTGHGDMYVVQFVTQPLAEYRAQLAAAGAEIRHFLPNHAYIVELSGPQTAVVANLPFVRWVGPYQAAYRLEEALRVPASPNEKEVLPTQQYNILLFAGEASKKGAVADRIRVINGHVTKPNAGKNLVRASLTPEQLYEVATWNEVCFIDRWGPMEKDMNNAREYGGANYLEYEIPEGFAGQGVRGEVYDAGFNLNHVDFASRPLIVHGTAGTDSHGAATSGIVFGDGTGNSDARGLLPLGQGIVSYYGDTLGEPSRYAHTGELLQFPYNGIFQTSSVGSPRTTQYTTISAEKDTALFDFDITHCQSQSNSGWEDSRPEAWAKNVISGGGVRHYNTLDPSDDCWCDGASTGLATDGRIKPDMCAYYDDILTTTTGSSTAYTTSFGGTSGATPIIAGHVGLIHQMWAEGIFGNDVDPEGTVFSNRAHMTTAKALLINSGKQYPFSGVNHDLTRKHQGWGFPDVQRLYDMREQVFVINEDVVLQNMEDVSYALNVDSGVDQFKATLVYADPAGNPGASQHRINDVTLQVTAPDGTVYWGNNGLLANNYSTPGGSPNTVDTVENVFVESPEAGLWTVTVIAAEVVQDGHVETGEVDVDFALVVSGVNPCSSAGSVQISGNLFACEAVAEVRVLDCDLNLDPDTVETYEIDVRSTSEPLGETVLLTETGPGTAAFSGMVTLSETDANGVLLVAHDDVVTATYIDEDDGMGGVNVVVEDEAIIDCQPPTIVDVQAINVEARTADITYTADEPVRATVHYGLNCNALNETASVSLYETQPVVSLSGLDDNTVYYYSVEGEDAAGNVTVDPQCYSFQTPEVPDFFTEEFSSNDLDFLKLTFRVVGGSDHYDGCVEEIAALPTDPAGGTNIPLSDDDSEQINVSGGNQVALYDVNYTSFFVGSNGYITFGSGDTDYTESLEDHFDLPRISALFDDLNPNSGGTISYKQLADRVAVTWQNVPEYYSEGANTFQVELYFDGTIVIAYESCDSADNIVGLSEGEGISPDFLAMDLSELGDCQLIGDMNCDGVLDFDDINPFVLALTGSESYYAAYPDCDWLNGDVNGDGTVDFDDINVFVSLIGG